MGGSEVGGWVVGGSEVGGWDVGGCSEDVGGAGSDVGGAVGSTEVGAAVGVTVTGGAEDESAIAREDKRERERKIKVEQPKQQKLMMKD